MTTTAPDCRAPARGPDVPTTVLLGRRWPAGAQRSILRVTRCLADHLGHDVEVCDLDAPGEPLRLVARRAAARGAMHLVVLPLALDDPARRDRRGVDPVAAAVAPWPFLRVHRGETPAPDDVARMLGDHARTAASSLTGRKRNPADVVVVIATGDGGNPTGNAEVAKLARLVYEAHRFADVTYAFTGYTTPSLENVIARSAQLGARGIAVVPYVLFDQATCRRIAAQARAAAAAAGIDVAVARPLEAHPALSWALVRRHLEALSDATVLPGVGAPWVNPDLLRVLQHAHGHSPRNGRRVAGANRGHPAAPLSGSRADGQQRADGSGVAPA